MTLNLLSGALLSPSLTDKNDNTILDKDGNLNPNFDWSRLQPAPMDAQLQRDYKMLVGHHQYQQNHTGRDPRQSVENAALAPKASADRAAREKQDQKDQNPDATGPSHGGTIAQ